MKYKIQGDNLPVVICELENGESMKSEGGAMSWMSDNLEMETKAGGVGKAFGRIFSGEKIFQNIYTAKNGNGFIAFASKMPGNIKVVEIRAGHSVVCQKTAFLASTIGVDLSVYFQKKVGTALFGGEGFIMQKLSGEGVAFIEIDGSAVEYELAAGQRLVIDTGYLAMCDDTVDIDIKSVKGVKNVLFGGEGLFHTIVTGPGRVIVQTMPLNNIVALVASQIPSN